MCLGVVEVGFGVSVDSGREREWEVEGLLFFPVVRNS